MVELLVVVGMIAVLASLLLPAVNRVKDKAQAIYCAGNLSQIQKGFQMYADDNGDHFPDNRFDPVDGVQQSLGGWVLGNAQYDTNTANIKAGVIYPLVGSVSVYRCPADRAIVMGQSSMRRTRSYALDGFIHTSSPTGPNNSMYGIIPAGARNFTQTDLGVLSPSACFVFIDENEDSIDDGIFAMSRPFSWANEEVPGDSHDWYELPSDRHSQGCNLSFVDGHVEPWHWKHPKRFKRVQQRATVDLDDLRKLQHATPSRQP